MKQYFEIIEEIKNSKTLSELNKILENEILDFEGFFSDKQKLFREYNYKKTLLNNAYTMSLFS